MTKSKLVTWTAAAAAACAAAGVCYNLHAGGPPPKAQAVQAKPAAAEAEPPKAPGKVKPAAALSLKLAPGDYPRVDGSTSAHPLGVLVACRLTGTPCEWFSPIWGGTRRLLPVDPDAKETAAARAARRKWRAEVAELRAEVAELEASGGGEGASEELKRKQKALKAKLAAEARLPSPKVHGVLHRATRHSGTHGAYTQLIKGQASLLLEARLPSEDELKLAREKKVELAYRPVALDAFVFLLNVANPVRSLTVQQIRDIYAGRITNWKTVGGADHAIEPFARERNSGSQETMEKLVMKGMKMAETRSMIGYTMAGPYNLLSRRPHGMGFTFYYYNRFMQPSPAIKLCGVGGVVPDSESIRSRRYFFTTEVWLVWRKDLPAESTAAKIRDWLLTKEGQGVVADSGYVPVG
jgi:phosphate transport system substrate-binding protein